MGKRIKFSPLKARILMMIGPMFGAIFFGLYSCSAIYHTLKVGLSFWLDLIRENFMLILFFIWIHMSLVESIYRMIKNNLLLNSNIQELRDCYPELEEDLQNLNDADYFDKDLQVLVYGDHLICYRTFDIAYLPECSKIGAFMKASVFRLSRFREVRRVHFSAWYLDGSESGLRTDELRKFIGMNQNAHKDALFDYLRENFDYIELETFD
ncbi:hypothetical protein [Streptococcus sanguinis]|uniref:Uncharacterized protein n=1 Tax=Streptococcus sanguinis SK353 TaxID=888815 RepID=F0FDI4_STRSA|nr:hypothetical protein [Streptococcus sanguinis]EGC23154.1 hypothetical protein HMPREF9388_0766 [Streptococcus sanguinis SK353]